MLILAIAILYMQGYTRNKDNLFFCASISFSHRWLLDLWSIEILVLELKTLRQKVQRYFFRGSKRYILPNQYLMIPNKIGDETENWVHVHMRVCVYQVKLTACSMSPLCGTKTGCGNLEKLADKDPSAPEDSKNLVDQFSFLPQLIASVKKVVLEDYEEVRPKADECANFQMHISIPKEEPTNEVELVSAHDDLELEPKNDHVDTSTIEPTKAEEEAIAKGLRVFIPSQLKMMIWRRYVS
ncbi:unnamed protein product [Lupinus luteus]|uniref:Uncharacterized protein n=1 Tax=Lupinus luteus TaxID=3873 RepID=A0AAV1WN84_LUPLU